MQLHCAGNCSTGTYYVQAKCAIIAQWENNYRKQQLSEAQEAENDTGHWYRPGRANLETSKFYQMALLVLS